MRLPPPGRNFRPLRCATDQFFSGKRNPNPKPGNHLDFFLIEDMPPTRLCLTARDKQLSTMTCVPVENQSLAITSSVITHNRFGRVYMLPVAPPIG